MGYSAKKRPHYLSGRLAQKYTVFRLRTGQQMGNGRNLSFLFYMTFIV